MPSLQNGIAVHFFSFSISLKIVENWERIFFSGLIKKFFKQTASLFNCQWFTLTKLSLDISTDLIHMKVNQSGTVVYSSVRK